MDATKAKFRDLSRCFSPEFFRALAEPNRIAILLYLAENGREMTVSEVTKCCPVNFSVVARHLKVLKEAGILDADKRGREVYYRVRAPEMVNLLRSLADGIEACCPTGCCSPESEDHDLREK
ncbi:MAG: ArsR/SmtB family transcription factor [Planctomycetota bacterium]|jgi:DNA-binding transcriptional ArsR family regulator